jgi:hypothetical protein
MLLFGNHAIKRDDFMLHYILIKVILMYLITGYVKDLKLQFLEEVILYQFQLLELNLNEKMLKKMLQKTQFQK